MPQQLDARRFEDLAQRALGAQPLGAAGADEARAARIDGSAIDIEALRKEAQETLAPGRVEGEIGMAETLQTVAHLLAEPFGIVTRQLRPDRRADHIARRLGHIAPRRAQVVQCSVKHGVQETCTALAHVRS